MCRSKMATNAAQPTRKSPPSTRRSTRSSNPPSSPPAQSPNPLSEASIGDFTSTSTSTSNSKNYYYNSNNTFSTLGSSAPSLASLRESLPDNPTVYDITEIRTATNNFLARRHSDTSSSPCWRCSLRGKDAIVFQRKFHRPTSPSTLNHHLSLICKSHHVTIVKLLGASLSGGYIFLVYEFVPGVNLADCLRNPNNPSFTVLSTWMSRIKIATDLANALDYIHNSTGLSTNLVHNHIKSRSVVVADPSLAPRICHFGTSILCGEIEIEDQIELKSNPKLRTSRSEKFEGTNGYMSPEFRGTGEGTQGSDVYAFGVVVLELVSGEEPVRYTYDKARREYVRRGVVEVAREVVEEGEGRVRRWVDRRLRDSFPVEVAGRLTRLALECVCEEAERRPNIRRVAGKISKLYLESQNWADRIQPTPDLTVSFGPR